MMLRPSAVVHMLDAGPQLVVVGAGGPVRKWNLEEVIRSLEALKELIWFSQDPG
jgi:hypothetical protein